MSNALSLTAAAIVACLLLYLYPVGQSYEQQDQIAYNIAYKAVTKFTDSVRTKGYITPDMYTDFMDELDRSGNLYDVQLQHDAKKYNPIYEDPADSDTFLSDYEVYYESFYTEDILARLFPDNPASVADEERRYELKQQDYFSVTVRNTNATNADRIRSFLNRSELDGTSRIYIPYGGMVLNEDY